ncbi:MAG: restriction endonuclease subunit S [Treponema sp.]|nr:restriction endonuclease subunit S [Treponema sp.]
MPEGWAWCRLHSISVLLNGDRGENYPSKNDYVKQGIPFINAGCLDNGFIDFSLANYITEEKYNSLRAGKIQEGDILYCLRGSLGKTGIVINNSRGAISSSLCIFRLSKVIQPEFFLHVLNSSIILNQQNLVDNGTAQPNLSAKDVSNYFIPLPSISEQQIIISAIEKLFEQIDTLEENKADLQNIIKQTKSKILDLAIHGKLVPQDPNDEPAEELLKRIATSDNRPYKKIEEEEPYELPSNWSWCYLCDICSKIKRGKSPKYTDKSTIMAFAQKCNQKDGPTSLEKALYIDESSLKKYQEDEKMQFNDIVINSTGTGTLGRVGIFNCPIPDDVNAVYPDSHVTTVRILPEIDKLYCYYFIKNKQSYLETMGEGSTNQKELKPDTISSLYFPLPPYSEQLRIVSKIEELFSYLDKISFNLE